MEKFVVRPDRVALAVECYPERGPCWGNLDLWVLNTDGRSSAGCRCWAVEYETVAAGGGEYAGASLSGGSEFFAADEIEVFAV